MKKIGLLVLAMVIALGTLGAAFALWSEELVIDTTVETGNIDITYNVVCDDPPEPGLPPDGNPDPCTPPAEPPKDVAYCEVTPVAEGVDVLLTGAYPGYSPTLDIDVTNDGSVPVHLYVYLHFKQNTWVSDDCGDTWTKYVYCNVLRMVPSTDYHMDFSDAGQPTSSADDADLDVHLTDIDCTQLHNGATANGSLDLLVKQDADEKASYRFNLVIVAQQWNEAAVAPTFP